KRNYSIVSLSEKLKETRSAVMRLSNNLSQLNGRLSCLQDSLQFQLTSLNERVHRVEAKNHVDFVVDKWRNGLWDKYPPLISLYLLVEELHWGDFGVYRRAVNANSKVHELIQYLCNQIFRIIEEELDLPKNNLFIVSDWLKSDVDLSDEQRDMLIFLYSQAKIKESPFAWSIASYVDNYSPPHVFNEVPIVLSPSRIVESLIDEFAESLGKDDG
ncbi:MAG: diguanylate cyclase regulator RdcB family protein, partial [Cyanobacteria bacterium J06626_4]